MTMTLQPAALDERLVASAIGALELLSVHLGRTLGLYDALDGGRTAPELAAAAAIDGRYAREWLEQQAVAGFVAVDDPALPWDRRRYELSAEQRALLVAADDPAHVSPLADMVGGIGRVLDQVAAAYRTGGGVPYAQYGKAFRDGQGGINRPAFAHDLPASWLEAAPGVAARLWNGGRVLDVGCGTGWSAIALAAAFPAADVVGIDNDPASIADARANAAAAGVAVRFECADAAALDSGDGYDLVLILETLHDLAQPVPVLRDLRRRLRPGGVVLVADEKVAEHFTAPGDDMERFMYGWSVLHCLPASLAEPASAGIGTVLRPGLVRAMAADAGFASVEESDIDAGFFRLYVLRP